jgi:hypothetical protein
MIGVLTAYDRLPADVASGHVPKYTGENEGQSMDRDSLKKRVKRRPFKPFRLYVDDGGTYDVRHPDMLMVAAETVVIGIPPASNPTADDVEDYAWVDLDHIARAEPLKAPRG